ncbi:HAD-IIB family hydrolase [Candidatus Agathobaculum pullicola]|uniref:HAD-IIB family hydrolase n=1 Tax=Candidatus Agathobaculum pullicola TaxID=2838426 RepID=UPI003F8E409A
MKKFDGMMLACDMDGTLLDSDRQISHVNLQALRYFTTEGGLFSLATGRAYAAVTDYIGLLPINAPYSLLNGSLVLDKQNRMLHCAGMPEQTPELIEQVLFTFPKIGCEIFLPDRILICRISAETEQHMRVLHLAYDCVSVTDLPDPADWCQINFTGKASEVSLVRMFLKQFKDLFHAVCTMPTFCEVTRWGISKGTAMMQIASDCNVSRNKIYAVGDSDNDLSMLKEAAISFVPENASPDMFRHTVVRIRDNDHDAVAHVVEYLERYHNA